MNAADRVVCTVWETVTRSRLEETRLNDEGLSKRQARDWMVVSCVMPQALGLEASPQ